MNKNIMKNIGFTKEVDLVEKKNSALFAKKE